MDEKRAKRRWSLLPWLPLALVADAMMVGAAKYGDDNWRAQPRDLFFDAAQRHLVATKFTSRDLQTGLPHLAHAAANILILLAIDIESHFHGTEKEILEGPLPKGAQSIIAAGEARKNPRQ